MQEIQRIKHLIGETTGQSPNAVVDLVSGQIHKHLGMDNQMPTVCRIMWEKEQHGFSGRTSGRGALKMGRS